MESVVKHGHLLLKGGVISFMGGLFKCFYRAIKVLFFLLSKFKTHITREKGYSLQRRDIERRKIKMYKMLKKDG